MPSTSDSTQVTQFSAHIESLDMLRGLAILAVIWHHLAYKYFPAGWWITSYGAAAAPITLLSHGWLGVNLFFILSGFVLYWPYANRSRELKSKSEILGFYARRAKRLLPLYYFSIFLLIGLVGYASPRSLLLLLTISFNFTSSDFMPPLNWVLWSLGVEIWLSVIFPFLLLFIARFGWQRTTIFVLATSILIRALSTQVPDFEINQNTILHPVKDSIFGRLDDFFVGMLIAYHHSLGQRPKHPKLLLALGVISLFGVMIYTDLVMSTRLPSWGIIFTNSVFQFSASAILAASLATYTLRLRPLELLGMMCYSLYIWHGVLLRHLSPDLRLITQIQYAVILLAVGWLSYRYIEFGHISSASRLLPSRPQRITPN